MAQSLFIKADEVAELLGVSRAEAYGVIKMAQRRGMHLDTRTISSSVFIRNLLSIRSKMTCVGNACMRQSSCLNQRKSLVPQSISSKDIAIQKLPTKIMFLFKRFTRASTVPLLL